MTGNHFFCEVSGEAAVESEAHKAKEGAGCLEKQLINKWKECRLC